MTTLQILATGLVGATAAMHALTVGASIWATQRPLRKSTAKPGAGVTVLRPVRGLENGLEETLRSTFRSSYEGPLELIFCCADGDDPVVPLVNRLIAEFPEIDARLMIGDDRVSGNPKLNNLVKGWSASSHTYVLMADSNVLLPHDYIQRLFARWTEGTGLVTSPPAAIRPENICGRLEAAFINTYQDRWQLTSDAFGNGFAQGKILFWERAFLEKAGGLAALGHDMAEDIASTKVVRDAGLNVRLLGELLPQPIGKRSFKEVWDRQLRWAKVRRMGFPALYAAEILSASMVPLLVTAVLVASGSIGWGWLPALIIYWFGLEFLLAKVAGWPASVKDVLTWGLRDALLPVLWVKGWIGKGFEWRGNAMDASDVVSEARN